MALRMLRLPVVVLAMRGGNASSGNRECVPGKGRVPDD
jgi:hypothetical protein